MMLVVVIIGLLATVVIFNIAGQTDAALKGVTITRMGQVKSALSQYYSRNGSYPVALNALWTGTTPLLEKEPLDGWKHHLLYLVPAQEPGKDFSLYSAGKDGKLGTTDDINVWTMDDAGT
jgi:general secretion pathway protein G